MRVDLHGDRGYSHTYTRPSSIAPDPTTSQRVSLVMRSTVMAGVVILCCGVACGAMSGVGADPDGPGGPVGDPEGDTLTGCAGVYNPDQVLDLYLELSSTDWDALIADTTNSVYFPAKLHCNDEAPITVAVRRKRSGGAPKVGLKIDINRIVAKQSWHELKKLSLENGISEGGTTGSVGDLVSEYLSWRTMQRSGAITGRATFARVHVNGAYLGAYVNVEQVDKRFLRTFLGDDSGWLYKKSGSADDGYKTNETMANPYEAYFCFWERMGCSPPTDLATSLPDHLDIPQMLRVGAVNALIANTDSILFKDNNFIFYDYAAGPRLYLPWDLDTTMMSSFNVFNGSVPGGTTMFTNVLFSHWNADYVRILTELLGGSLALAEIHAELARVEAVAASALDSDPAVDGDTASAVSALKAWWTSRHAEVTTQVQTHQ
jgi:hypothetical protein